MPLDISIKSNRKHHKTVLYSKSNENMVGQLFWVIFHCLWAFFSQKHPASSLHKLNLQKMFLEFKYCFWYIAFLNFWKTILAIAFHLLKIRKTICPKCPLPLKGSTWKVLHSCRHQPYLQTLSLKRFPGTTLQPS